MNRFAQWLEQHQLSCFYKKYTGIDCPGCGMQRSFIQLVKGNLIASFEMYPALIPLLFTILFMCLHLIFDFKHGAKILIYTFSLSAAMIVVSYIVKMC